MSARGRAGSVVLVCALLAGVLAATVGAGYIASRPLLDDASAYLAKGTGIAVVNAVSHSVEAEAIELAPGKHSIEVVELPNGEVYIVDNDAKRARKLDGSTMRPGQELPLDRDGARVVAAPDGGYLVDGDRVSRIGPDGERRTTARLSAMFDGEVVPDASEGVWVLTTDNVVTHVVREEQRQHVPKELRTEHLTVADHRPVGLTAAGELLDLAAVPPRRITEDRVPHRDVRVGSAKGPGRWVLVLSRADEELVATDIRTGHTRTIPVHSGDLGSPVQAHDFAYVPDYDEHVVQVLNLATGEPLGDIVVPGKSRTFSLEVRAGRVWANDQFDRRAVVVTDGVDDTLVDKGDGPGLTDTEGHSEEPPDKPDGQAPPNEPDTQAHPPGESTPPVEVPDIEAGTSVESACARLGAAGLVCEQVPIGDGGEPGTVPDDPTDPAAGTTVSRGSEVAVRHYGPARVPSVVGMFVEDACTRIENTGLGCRSGALPDSAPDPSELDRVASQTPEDGGDIPPGGEVSLRYYDRATIENFVGDNGKSACAKVRTTYHTVRCRIAPGRTETQTNRPVGTVDVQEPRASAPVRTRQEVILHVVTPSNRVPDVVGLVSSDACATLEVVGYGCAIVADAPVAREILVHSTNPPAGTKLDPGNTVTIHIPPGERGRAKLVLCRRDNGDYVFRMLVDACQPTGFSQDKWPVGVVYPPGTAHQQLVPIYEHYCTGPANECGGFTQNRAYSRNPDPKVFGPQWQMDASSYVVVSLCTLTPDGTADGDPYDGLKPIFRVRYLENGGSVQNYTIRNSSLDPHPILGKVPDDREFLGCVWES
jgi:beta-lactam-binding protein with PASTA domain